MIGDERSRKGPPPMTFYFVRHAEKEKGDYYSPRLRHHDQPISRNGRRQARWLRQYLRDKDIERIYVSEYIRTRQTIEPLSRRLGVAPLVDARLNEIDIGLVDGMPDEKIMTDYPETWQALRERNADFHWPGGESGAEARKRITEFLAAQAGRSGNAVAVAHDGIIRILLCHLLDIPVYRRFEFQLGTAGLMELEWDADRSRWNVVRFNQDLAPERASR